MTLTTVVSCQLVSAHMCSFHLSPLCVVINVAVIVRNIGCDVRGDWKIFDFGLCRELKKCDLREAPDGFDCTGLTGSRRWMAPEVVLCKLYGLKADVYSCKCDGSVPPTVMTIFESLIISFSHKSSPTFFALLLLMHYIAFISIHQTKFLFWRGI
jgi:serine/threonine protein kinase